MGAAQRELRLDCQLLPAVGRDLTAYLVGLEVDLKSPASRGWWAGLLFAAVVLSALAV